MKRDVLANLVQDQKRFATQLKIRWALFVAALWVVSAGVVLALIPPDLNRSRRGDFAFAWGLGAIAILISTGVLASRRIRMHAHAQGLACSTCRRPLIGNLGETAVASGRCPECGSLIVDDDAP